MSQTVTIKEIAAVLQVSEDTVRRRRKDWGLDCCQCRLTFRPETFFRAAVVQALIKSKVVAMDPWQQ